METTVTGVFADPQAAQRAMQMLGSAGFAQERIDRIDHATPDYHHKVGQETSDLARGAMLGAALCACGSALAGAGLSGIWESTLLRGAAIGAVVGAVVGAAAGAAGAAAVSALGTIPGKGTPSQSGRPQSAG